MLFHDFTGKEIRHYVLATLRFVKLGYTWSWNSDLSRDFVLEILLRYINVFQWFDQWTNPTLYASLFTVVIRGTFGHSNVIEEILIEQWFKQKICVRYFTKMHSGSFSILLINKSDTMC